VLQPARASVDALAEALAEQLGPLPN